MKVNPIFISLCCHRLPWALLVLIWLVSAAPFCGQAATFSNTTSINIVAGAPPSPYPSTAAVSQVVGVITSISVSLSNLTHSAPDDLDILLEGPGGRKVLLMSDAGGSNAVSNVNLTFSDVAGSVTLPDTARISSGTYRPSNYDTNEAFPAPAPAGPYNTAFNVFNGTNPNGTWRLFVHDDMPSSNFGSIGGGWRLTLSLALPPVITAHPQSQTVAPGSDVTFDVAVSGTPPFGYQWLRNGQVLVPFGQGTASLTISNVQAANAGTYAVVVTNSANRFPGVTSSNAVLNVTGSLTLVEPPRSYTAAPGESVAFQVAAVGTPPLYYQWRLNGALLPGQTNSVLMLNNVQATSGGSFSVTVWNESDVFTTGQAQLLVPVSTAPEAADDFRSRPTLSNPRVFQGVVQGNSAMATNEPGEPLSSGGGKSVWYQWLAPADGIVTLTTRGSGFDTLLSVFTGTVLNNLTLVTKDDDLAGFYTSALRFNARRGIAYQWMIDGFGFAGAGGEYTLSWMVEPTTSQIPVIITNPQPQGVQQGSNATFSVVTASPLDSYQWFSNGLPIPNATGRVYTVFNVQSNDVAFYSVRVSNLNGFAAESPPVSLQRGSVDGLLAFDKIENLSIGNLSTVDLSPSGLRPSQGAMSVGLGETEWNQFPSQGNGGPGDPNPCNKAFFKTIWQSVYAEDDGIIQVDTVDSQVFVLLAVYEGVPTGLANLDVLAACDILSGPVSQPCVAHWTATKGSSYTAVVSAMQGSGSETIKITCKMGIASPIPEAPQCLFVSHGGSQPLQVPANNWCPPPTVQWRFNGQGIPDATSTTLLLANFNAALAGTYSVVMSNFVSVVTNTVAHVAQSGAPVLHYALQTNNGTLEFVVTGSGGQPFVLETNANLAMPWPWMPAGTNKDPCLPLVFTNAPLDARRFFRAVLWPGPGP